MVEIEKRNNKKNVLLFVGIIVGIIALMCIGAYIMHKQNYKSCTCIMESIDEYGYAKMSNGEEIVFRGNFVCNDGSNYYHGNIAQVIGKELYIEYRVTDEGDLKVEKFSYDDVTCEKRSLKRQVGE